MKPNFSILFSRFIRSSSQSIPVSSRYFLYLSLVRWGSFSTGIGSSKRLSAIPLPSSDIHSTRMKKKTAAFELKLPPPVPSKKEF
jgi:hypothetical protein